jgi:hypothetical protein
LEERIASIITVKRMSEKMNFLVVPSRSIIFFLIIEAIRSSERWILTKATQRHIPEDVFHSHRRENLKFYIPLTG